MLTQNSKMKKSSVNGLVVVNWTIPAFLSAIGVKTCHNAGICAKGCYARSGAYAFGNVKTAHEAKLEASQCADFSDKMIQEINKWLKKRTVKTLKVRIHDSGDFYSQEYTLKWFKVMNHFLNDSRVSFYAYTKQVNDFKRFKLMGLVPVNFTLIYSLGGKQDKSINAANDRHARVFESLKALKQAGYIDGTDNDMVAAIGKSNKIGLCYHGVKNFGNTAWDKVAR